MFKELLVSVFVSSSLHAAPLEISEEEMPALPNESSPFRGQIKHNGYIGHTWVGYPHWRIPRAWIWIQWGGFFVAEPTGFGSAFPTSAGLAK